MNILRVSRRREMEITLYSGFRSSEMFRRKNTSKHRDLASQLRSITSKKTITLNTNAVEASNFMLDCFYSCCADFAGVILVS